MYEIKNKHEMGGFDTPFDEHEGLLNHRITQKEQ